MRKRFAILSIAVALLASAHVLAARSAAFSDFREADLIFQDSPGAQSVAVAAATGSHYTHMGIIDVRNGKPVVLEAARTVRETPLDEFIARGKGGRYSVYRAPLADDKVEAVVKAARRDMGKPYDIYFRLDGDTIYCSELPYRAFKAAGVPIGTVEKIGNLKINVASAMALIDSRWKKHPDCKGDTKEACIRKLERQDIVTPASVARDKSLTQVFSNF